MGLASHSPARIIQSACCHLASPGVDGQKGLRLQLNSRQSSTVDTSIPFRARHFEYSTEYSTYIAIFPADRLPHGWPKVESGASPVRSGGARPPLPPGAAFGAGRAAWPPGTRRARARRGPPRAHTAARRSRRSSRRGPSRRPGSEWTAEWQARASHEPKLFLQRGG
eukprot:1176936-Prorocentrum_minimum.AAC.2